MTDSYRTSCPIHATLPSSRPNRCTPSADGRRANTLSLRFSVFSTVSGLAPSSVASVAIVFGPVLRLSRMRCHIGNVSTNVSIDAASIVVISMSVVLLNVN